jgi:hypothetical protein
MLSVLAVSAVLVGSLAGCSSDDSASPSTTAGAAHGDHGGGGTYGSSMAPETVSVAKVADLGPGPRVGDTWTGTVGLNVCGRFLEPPTAAGPPVDGVGTDGTGHFTVAPATEAQAGHAATVGKLLQQTGITMSTGSLSLPDSTRPATIEEGNGIQQVAGATFGTGQMCGTTPAEVQLWIYTKDAADTGTAVRQVVTDPQDVPVVEDGMVFVVAFSPESSLPTLPPSALAG